MQCIVKYKHTRLFLFQGMHLCFLGLYAFVILFSFHKPWPSIYEIVLLCWVGVIIMDEIRQVSEVK